MSELELKYKAIYDVGFPIFKKLFDLKKDDFITVMKCIFSENEDVLEILNSNPSVNKKLRNDEPQEISVFFYSGIKITYFGVDFQPEHGSASTILRFNNLLNIDAAMSVLNS